MLFGKPIVEMEMQQRYSARGLGECHPNLTSYSPQEMWGKNNTVKAIKRINLRCHPSLQERSFTTPLKIGKRYGWLLFCDSPDLHWKNKQANVCFCSPRRDAAQARRVSVYPTEGIRSGGIFSSRTPGAQVARLAYIQ